MMYKSDRRRVQDAIIPFVIANVLQMHEDSRYDNAKGLLTEDVKTDIPFRSSSHKRLSKLDKKLFDYFFANDWKTNKIFMIMSQLAFQLHDKNAVNFRPNTQTVLEEINDQIIEGCGSVDGIDKIDSSATKQVPKVLKLIQNEGYF